MNKFSPKISEILAFSREETIRLCNAEVCAEHVLIALMRDKSNIINGILLTNDIDYQTIKQELELKIKQTITEKSTPESEITLSDNVNNILKLSVLEARVMHSNIIETHHLLLAMMHDSTNNGAKQILEQHNMNYKSILDYIEKNVNITQNGMDLTNDDDNDIDFNPYSGDENNTEAKNKTTQKVETKKDTPILDRFSTDITQAAREGKLDPVVGREREMERVMEILCRRRKNNPILIGEPGVGKSAIVEGLAQLIVNRKTSPILYKKRIVNLDLTGVVAGTKYRGQFEERIKAIIKEIEEQNNLIVFIDEIHTIIGAGSTTGGMDAANILKPALSRGTIQCIGATTLDEYRTSIEKDGALERRFQKIIVNPTTTNETLQILKNIKDRYEDFHNVSYTDEALETCVKLSERYMSTRAFPDKAIDVLDETGAHMHLQSATIPKEILEKEKEVEQAIINKLQAIKAQNFELAAQHRDEQEKLGEELNKLNEKFNNKASSNKELIDEKEISNVIAKITGIPVQKMASEESERLKNMADTLKQKVIAQDKAIEKIVKSIQRNRIGLKEANSPVGVFMFLGPTGVGKTYLAKQLAEELFGSSKDLIRIDMSEYTEGFNVSRLVGAAPGYVGYEEGGQLTEKVRRHPYSIVLLDEIEKAHQNVFNLLLQVLDEGRLTDSNGRLIDFRNTVIIMTSNTGTRQLKEFGKGVGFNAGDATLLDGGEKDREQARNIIQKSLSKQFSPEFLNRLDEIITFEQLNKDAINKITEMEVANLTKRIEDIGYRLSISDKAKQLVANNGYDIQFGARPLKRAIQSMIEDGICEQILNKNVEKGDTIYVDTDSDNKHIIFEKNK